MYVKANELRLQEKKTKQELNKNKKNEKYWKSDSNKDFMLSISNLVNTYGNF